MLKVSLLTHIKKLINGNHKVQVWDTSAISNHYNAFIKTVCDGKVEVIVPEGVLHELSEGRHQFAICKKAYEFSTQLSNCLRILKEIHLHPGIRTQDLANVAGVSVRTAQRYIRALQDAGEWIEYDEQKRGWYLQHGKTPLLDF